MLQICGSPAQAGYPSAPKTVSVKGHLDSPTHPDRNNLALPHVPQKASGVWKLHCQYVFSPGILSAVGGHPRDFSDVVVEYYHISHIKKRTFILAYSSMRNIVHHGRAAWRQEHRDGQSHYICTGSRERTGSDVRL